MSAWKVCTDLAPVRTAAQNAHARALLTSACTGTGRGEVVRAVGAQVGEKGSTQILTACSQPPLTPLCGASPLPGGRQDLHAAWTAKRPSLD